MERAVLALMVLIISVMVLVGTASAFNSADLHKLQTTGNCVDCNLSGAVLIHWKLKGADLSGANLAGSNLTDTYLAGANLSGANLSGTVLSGTSLAGANLMGARLAGTNLSYADLAGATWVDGSPCERPSLGWCRRR